MPKQPKFRGRHITNEDHAGCVRRLGKLYPKYIDPILEGTGLYDRARWHRDPDAPCVYVFRNKDLYEAEDRGIFIHLQNTRDENGVEIVFRRTKSFSPLPSPEWAGLGSERWQPNKDEWKALRVARAEDIPEAKRLIKMAIERYDREYGESLA